MYMYLFLKCVTAAPLLHARHQIASPTVFPTFANEYACGEYIENTNLCTYGGRTGKITAATSTVDESASPASSSCLQL